MVSTHAGIRSFIWIWRRSGRRLKAGPDAFHGAVVVSVWVKASGAEAEAVP